MLSYFATRLPVAATEARSAAPLPLGLADVVEQRILAAGQLPISDAPSVLGFIAQNRSEYVQCIRAARSALVLRLQRTGPVDARTDIDGLLEYEKALSVQENDAIGTAKRALSTAAAARVRLPEEVLQIARAACGNLNSQEGRT